MVVELESVGTDLDVDGTTNLDIVDIDGAVQLDATFTSGVDGTGYDAKFFGTSASAFMLWDEDEDDLVLSGVAALSIDTTTDATNTTSGSFHTDGGVGIAKKLYVGTDLDVDGTTNLDAVDIDGAVQIDNTVTVGENDTGYDVKFFGDTASAYLLWDTSADKLLTAGGAVIDIVKDKLLIGGTAVTTTAAELNLLDNVSGLVQADLTKLAAVDATAAELNYLDITTLGTSAASKAVTADANGDVLVSQEFRAVSYNDTYVSVASGASPAINCETGNYFKHVLDQNATFTFSNPPASGTGYSFVLHLVQDSTARTVTWPGSVDWAAATAPTISVGSGDDDFFVFATSDGGTIWYGFTAGQAMA